MVLERHAIVALKEGLHARPAAQFVKLAKGFDASIEVVKGERVADAKSMVKLMLLAVQEGEEILLRADGFDAAKALADLAALVSGGIEAPPAPAAETVEAPAPVIETLSPGEIRGLPGNPGFAVGPAFIYLPEPVVPERHRLDAAVLPAERQKFEQAVNELAAHYAAQEAVADPLQREVLAALRELAGDAALSEQVVSRINEGQDAASSVHEVGLALAERFAVAESEYFRARAEDMRDITHHLVDTLLGVAREDLSLIAEPCVVVAGALGAVQFARLPKQHVRGLLLLEGGPTSHIAIMARAFGIPLVMSAQVEAAQLRPVREVALDGAAGVAILDPDAATRERFAAKAAAIAAEREELRRYIDAVPHTRAGQPIEVAANIGSVEEAAVARAQGAMGVGLFRTEFLFMGARRLPTEEDQYVAYRRVLEIFAPFPVLIRTLDIGGDKPLPGLAAEPEENPFLGWRGIRMCLDRPDLFKPQLRALLRAAVHGRLRVMFPMISDVAEVRRARALLGVCRAELDAEGVRTGPIETGIMVETPAAALCAEELAREVDFMSIGTNDLTQYTMAADRAHRRLVHLGRVDHPAVLKMIEMTCRAATAAGIWIGVCGESAGDPSMIPRLLGWGVTELSMSAPLISRAKKLVMEF